MIGYIALGSNRGDRAGHLGWAWRAMAGAGLRPLRLSSLYRTAPVGATGRAWYLNGVAEVESDLPPRRLLERLRALERQSGRRRHGGGTRKVPRTLDLDLILYGRVRMRTPRLTLPHPRFERRGFVLKGLVELAPGLRAPGTARTMRQLWRRAGGRVN